MRRLQHLSPVYTHADLCVVQVDPAAFKAAEEAIYQAADVEGRRPTNVPLAILHPYVETRGGHTYTRLYAIYGRPIIWMAPFMGSGKRVKRIKMGDSNSDNSHTLYELN